LRRSLIHRDGNATRSAIEGTKLHRVAPVPDHRHAFAVELDVVRPQRGVEHQAGKILFASE